jgi:hypothetical protein
MPVPRDSCTDPSLGYLSRRETSDDWGTDGDDTKHAKIPEYPLPRYWQAQANFPKDKEPEFVDLVFYDQ